MGVTRRPVLRAMAATLAAPSVAMAQGSAANQWFPLRGDDGGPVPNGRAPIELAEDIEDLPGAIWAGPRSASVQLVEFYDYNCPWCRAAHTALDALRRADQDLRVGLIDNPILSARSADAAKVGLALLRMKGAGAAYGLHARLFASPGRVDGPRALDIAASLGADKAELERMANGPEVQGVLARQMRLAASLGIATTPSWVVGGATVQGFPGPNALSRIVEATRSCGAISC